MWVTVVSCSVAIYTDLTLQATLAAYIYINIPQMTPVYDLHDGCSRNELQLLSCSMPLTRSSAVQLYSNPRVDMDVDLQKRAPVIIK